MPAFSSIALGVAGLGAGAVSGAMGKRREDSSGITLSAASDTETGALGLQNRGMAGLEDLTNAGPGLSDVQNATSAGRSFSSMLEEYSRTGGIPTADDISTGNNLAGGLFNQRRTQLEQNFNDQNTEASRLAARLGRGVDDPIIQAKLRTGFMKDQALLDAEQSDYGNTIAMNLPGARLGYAQQNVGLLDSMAAKAFSNRAAITALGSNIVNSERNFRLQTGERWGKSQQGGGLGDALTGGIAGLGAGLGMADNIAGLFPGSPPPGVSGYGPTAPGSSTGIGSLGAWSGASPGAVSRGISGFGPTIPGATTGFGSQGPYSGGGNTTGLTFDGMSISPSPVGPAAASGFGPSSVWSFLQRMGTRG